MDVRVLGPLVVTEAGLDAMPTAVKPRKVLALLAMNPGRTVHLSTLTEELWNGHPPRSAVTTLQTYVLQIRNRIGRALLRDPQARTHNAKHILVTRLEGYVLNTSGGFFDAGSFQYQAELGHQAMAAGRLAEAVDRFGRALTMWRGPALVDVQLGPVLEVQVTRLEEARTAALQGRIGAELALGRHHELLSELTALTARHPLNEVLHAQFMYALHACERRADALAVYARLERVLRRELGLAPDRELRRLRAAILECVPDLSPYLPQPLGAAAR
ncbi:AfsR/SARP family transcriptional regulator, partial [Streptomyces sp.]|uniref:AfsR/SARP family transcriptional regulator n=1 Tax=Streptomyces sp. TaxID=1931 RepID=UPI002F424E6B